MTKTKTVHRQKNKTQGEGASLLFTSARICAITLGVSALLLLLLSYIAYRCADPAALVDTMAYICLSLSSLIGGIIAAMQSHESASVTAACSGAMYVITLLLMALASDSINSPLYMLLGYGACMVLFVLGALIYKRLTSRSRRRRR